MNCSALAKAGPGILLTADSSHNLITDSNIFVLFGNGIEIDLGSDHNVIHDNTVEILSPEGYFAMLDENPSCGTDHWIDNTFTSASPASCIH